MTAFKHLLTNLEGKIHNYIKYRKTIMDTSANLYNDKTTTIHRQSFESPMKLTKPNFRQRDEYKVNFD